jgi:probable phosphoglycerate mutase
VAFEPLTDGVDLGVREREFAGAAGCVSKAATESPARAAGASGPAAIGAVLKDPKYRDVDQVSKAIGRARNHHVAEYRALIDGLELARRHGIERIRVFLDSSLVVNTVNGDWNVKPEDLRELRANACDLVREFTDIKLCWVLREMNSEADALASQALGRPASKRRSTGHVPDTDGQPST